MDITRNQFFLAGLVFLFLGLQFRMTDTLLLTPEFTRYLAERTDHPMTAASDASEAILGAELRIPPKEIDPPEWLGWCLTSIGAVLILHSFAMVKPK